MKVVIALLALVPLAYAGAPVYGGKSNSFRKQDDRGNYAFGYNIVDPYGAENFRQEKGSAYGGVVGSYGLRDVDGRLRKVNYVADYNGFRAAIETNEPGTANTDPAAVILNGPDPYTGGLSVKATGKVPVHFNPGAHGPPTHGHGGYPHGPAPHHGAPHHSPYHHGPGYPPAGNIPHAHGYGPHGYGVGHAPYGHGHGHGYGHGPAHISKVAHVQIGHGGYGHGHGHGPIYAATSVYKTVGGYPHHG